MGMGLKRMAYRLGCTLVAWVGGGLVLGLGPGHALDFSALSPDGQPSAFLPLPTPTPRPTRSRPGWASPHTASEPPRRVALFAPSNSPIASEVAEDNPQGHPATQTIPAFYYRFDFLTARVVRASA